MWIIEPVQTILLSLLPLIIQLSHCHTTYECDHQLWDEAAQGKGVKRLDFSCRSGQVVWHAPYGGLFVNIKGPAKEHQLCIQAQSNHTSALISLLENNQPRRLITLPETNGKKQAQKHSICFPAHRDTLLFVEPDIGAFVSAKIVIDYDLETNPKYGEDACSPCTDEELLYHYCTSDFVATGHMKDVIPSPSANTIPVSLDKVKQSIKYFVKRSPSEKTYTGNIYSPAHCNMQHGMGKFLFMGKIKFNRAELRCAPRYEDFLKLQRTADLKGTRLCT